MDRKTYTKLEQDLISLAKAHNAEYEDCLIDFEEAEAPFFLIYKYNVPTLADMRMLAEKYDLTDILVGSETWGTIYIDFGLKEFESEEELDEFAKMLKKC